MEDKLSHDERRRLEALRQAQIFHARWGLPSSGQVLKTAESFDKYIKDGKVDTS